MNLWEDYLPQVVNTGSWVAGYTLPELRERLPKQTVVLPICSLGTPYAQLADLGDYILPPLYHEALDADLKHQIWAQVQRCFPYFAGTRAASDCSTTIQVVELTPQRHDAPTRPKILSFSVDTAVEQHGPHLPLATDTIQSYCVLRQLTQEVDGFVAGPPVDYGHLTWGLPFGMSIDLTPALLTRYLCGFANAMQEWLRPEMMYVVDVHGSLVHRQAIVQALEQSSVTRWKFRWLYDPLVEFAGERGDQHAGGVETALVELADSRLIDQCWWPTRIDDLIAGQMDLATANELTPNLPQFIEHVEAHAVNGIVGDVRNYYNVDASTMLERMLGVTRADLHELVGD